MGLRITFWGTRGTFPTAGPSTVRYGGSTPCLTVDDAAGHRIVLDAGTGIRKVDLDPASTETTILLSHCHWDHVQGLPFFRPLLRAGVSVHVQGPRPAVGTLAQRVEQLFDPVFYPVPPAVRLAVMPV